MFFPRCWKWSLCTFLLCLAGVRDAAGGVLTLAWDPSADSAVTGYIVFVGTESGKYSTTVNVGNQVQFVFRDAQPRSAYYFAVGAYRSDGRVGTLSAEVVGGIDVAPSQAPSPPPQAPVVSVAIPTSDSTFTTSEGIILIGGSASDDRGVSAVYWTNGRGGSGRATGTDQWVAAVLLRAGRNDITITAVDGDSNRSQMRLSIYRKGFPRGRPTQGMRAD